jgi:hypothetical protein
MFGFQTDAAVAAFGAAGTSVWRKAVLQCGEKRHFDAAERREAGCCGTSVLLVLRRCCGRSVGLAVFSVCIRSASRADSVQAVLRPAVLRSTDDSKADICDGTVDSGGESFGGQVFAGVRGRNVARSRSWPAAGALSGRIWRELRKGATAGRRGGGDFWRIRRHFTEMAAGAARYRSGMAGAGFGGKLVGGTRRTFAKKGKLLPLSGGPGRRGKAGRPGAESPEMRDGAGLLLRGRTAKSQWGRAI